METLPTELIIHAIAPYLTFPEQKALRLTCKRLRTVLFAIWKPIMVYGSHLQFTALHIPIYQIRIRSEDTLSDLANIQDLDIEKLHYQRYFPVPPTFSMIKEIFFHIPPGVKIVELDAFVNLDRETTRYLVDHYAHIKIHFGLIDLLRFCCAYDDTEAVDKLIRHGYDINRRYYYTTALTVTLMNRSGKMLQFLLERGANPNLRTFMSGELVLNMAVATKRINAIKLLVKYGADPKLTDTVGNSAISIATKMEDQQILELLTK